MFLGTQYHYFLCYLQICYLAYCQHSDITMPRFKSKSADQKRKESAEYARNKRLRETEEERAIRRAKCRESARMRRQNETPEERQRRLELNAEAARRRRLEMKRKNGQTAGIIL